MHATKHTLSMAIISGIYSGWRMMPDNSGIVNMLKRESEAVIWAINCNNM